MDYVIETNALTKRFPAKLAVDHIDMHVRRGDIYGLIGKNGAGKTTAMKMILGILTPTDGSLSLFGGEPLTAARRRIGSLIEAPGIYKNCSAKENMKRVSILAGGDDAKIDELLRFVGLGDVGTRKAGTFSLGMKQRLGIAIALLGDPEILILDEPINGLDPAGIKEIRDMILSLNREKGVTFLISSHLLDELGKIATTYGIINNGKLIDEVSAEEIARQCTHGIRVVVSDPEKASEILSAHGHTSLSRKGNALLLGTDAGRSAEVNELLVTGGVSVSELTALNNDFEDYFIQRLGK